jgi:hypothetical protein
MPHVMFPCAQGAVLIASARVQMTVFSRALPRMFVCQRPHETEHVVDALFQPSDVFFRVVGVQDQLRRHEKAPLSRKRSCVSPLTRSAATNRPKVRTMTAAEARSRYVEKGRRSSPVAMLSSAIVSRFGRDPRRRHQPNPDQLAPRVGFEPTTLRLTDRRWIPWFSSDRLGNTLLSRCSDRLSALREKYLPPDFLPAGLI